MNQERQSEVQERQFEILKRQSEVLERQPGEPGRRSEVQKRKSELLAPAGSYDAARAAVNAGADAIYMGGPLFSARAYAESSRKETAETDGRVSSRTSRIQSTKLDGQRQPDAEQPDMLLQSIEYCHLHGVQVFMTLNTLLKDSEYEGLDRYLESYVRAGLDAVIVQDPGVLLYVQKHFPHLQMHASTQMTVTGPYYASLLKEMGVSRIVAPRELSLQELRAIYDATGLELEAFIHGALCYSYSGQCLMSSVLGGRSGNRGRCAGPCRLPYEVLDENGRAVTDRQNGYVLSMKDLNTLDRLPDLLDAGVMSFKIEGRMKPPLYVAGVTSVYRRYLNLAAEGIPYRVSERDQRLLSAVFDRGGSTDAYLDRHNGADMIAVREKSKRRVPDETLLQEIRENYLEKDRTIPIRLSVRMRIGESPVLTLFANDRGRAVQAEVIGETVVQRASNRPLSREEALSRLSRFGGTCFEVCDVKADLDENIFLPVGAMNALRRAAADKLKEKLMQSR